MGQEDDREQTERDKGRGRPAQGQRAQRGRLELMQVGAGLASAQQGSAAHPCSARPGAACITALSDPLGSNATHGSETPANVP